MAINPVQCMNKQMRGAILGTGPICVQVDHPDPPYPLSHNWCLEKTAPSSSPFAAMVTAYWFSPVVFFIYFNVFFL
jgi:hypothetical protein